ncbi:hypothetical protein SNEBB_001225, partial [Seison nebaliae]
NTSELWKLARENKRKASSRFIANANKNLGVTELKVGDFVRRKIVGKSERGICSKKLGMLYSEAYLVEKTFENGNVRIRSMESDVDLIVHPMDLVLEEESKGRSKRSR